MTAILGISAFCLVTITNPDTDGVTMPRKKRSARVSGDFESLRGTRQAGLLREFVFFLRENKKWWMVPIFLVLLGMSLIVVMGSTGVAPFIYTLF